MNLTPPLKYHGGKSYLASWIISKMPRHLHYVEPYFGGGAVLLERDPNDKSLWLSENGGMDGVSEVVGDINGDLINFWRVLRSKEWFSEFERACRMTPLAHDEFDMANLGSFSLEVGKAWAFFVRARQSRAGTFKGFTSLTRSRTRRGINGNASEWLSAVDGLAAVHARLEPVVIENMPAINLIKREDSQHTLYYCDAPYVHSTRTTKNAYEFEMTDDQHRELIDTLCSLKGKAMVSMYHHPIYDVLHLKYGWELVEKEVPNHASGGKEKRRMVECLWMNYR